MRKNKKVMRFYRMSSLLVVLGLFFLEGLKPLSAEVLTVEEKQKFFLAVVGLSDFYSPNIDSKASSIAALSSDARVGWGGGLLMQTEFFAPLALETGLFYLNRKHRVQSQILDYTESSRGLMLPVGVKLILSDLFHIGGGGYVYHRFGDLKQTYSLGSLAASNYNAGAAERWDLGFYLSAGLLIPVYDTWGLLVDARYSRGVTQLSKDKNVDIQSADWTLLAGAQFRY